MKNWKVTCEVFGIVDTYWIQGYNPVDALNATENKGIPISQITSIVEVEEMPNDL